MMYALDDKASEKRPLEKIELMKLGFAKCIFGSRYEATIVFHKKQQFPAAVFYLGVFFQISCSLRCFDTVLIYQFGVVEVRTINCERQQPRLRAD